LGFTSERHSGDKEIRSCAERSKNRSVQQPLFMEPSPFPCHPERTRISYLTALANATYVVLLKENHMQLTEAATLDRKSGEAEGSAVPRAFRGNVFQQAEPCDRF
jgi:hypothetical protein